MRRIFIIGLIAIFGCISPVNAQKFKQKYKYWSLGLNINAMNYMGELDPSPGIFSSSMKFTKPDIGLSLMKRIGARFSIRGNISFGKIEGNDALNASYSQKDIHRKIRNLSFKNTIMEMKADFVMDLVAHRGKPILRPEFVPYFFAGIAYFHHDPKAKTPDNFGGSWVSLHSMKLEGVNYSLNQLAIPIGVGFRYKINQRWDLAFEIGFRFTFTDYLDDVSGTYKGKENFKNDPLAAAMSDRSIEGLQKNERLANWVDEKQGYFNRNGYVTVRGYGRTGDQRGDASRNDMYIVTGFHLTHIIYNKHVKCPPKFRT